MQKKYHLTHANVGLIAVAYASALSLFLALLFYFQPIIQEAGLRPLFICILFIFLPYLTLKSIWLGIKIGEKL